MAYSYEEIDKEIRGLVNAKLKLKSSPADLPDDLFVGTASGFDSSQLLEFILSIENRFGLIVPDEDLTLENFDCISKIVRYVQAKSPEPLVS